MNIQSEKLELIRMILDTDNPGILTSIKRIFSNSKEVDFWDSLPQYQKDEILKGIEEIDKGEMINYEEFLKYSDTTIDIVTLFDNRQDPKSLISETKD
jgi:hypothetical protein